MNISLQCACGAVKGNVGPLSRTLNKRIVCMCNDCQAFAHYLGQTGQMLDSLGGTEIIAIHPARIRFTHGRDQLACIRLSDDGMRRWYAACCKTPIANTHPGNRLPFAGVHRSALALSGDQALGGIYARINGKGSRGVPKAILSALRFLAVGFLQGLGTPWPFPDVAPKVGTDSEYASLIEKVKTSGA